MPEAMRGMEGRAKTTSVTLAPEPGPRARLPVHGLILTCGKTDVWMDPCMDAQTAAWMDACMHGQLGDNAWMHAWVHGRLRACGVDGRAFVSFHGHAHGHLAWPAFTPHKSELANRR